jgi:hypothetical protein
MEQHLLNDKFVGRACAALFAVSLVTGVVRADEAKLVTLHALDAHGHPFDIESTRGQVVALTFASRYTREEADRVNQALLGHAAQGDLIVVSVVDLMGIPGIFHGYARRKAAEHDQAGRVYHVVDENGELRRAFAADPGKRVDILVIDRAGALRGRFTGQRELDGALRLVDELRDSTAYKN